MSTNAHRLAGHSRAACARLRRISAIALLIPLVAFGCSRPVREPSPPSMLPLAVEPVVTVRLSRYAGKVSLPIAIDGAYTVHDGSGTILNAGRDRLERGELSRVAGGFEFAGERFITDRLVLRPTLVATTSIRIDGRPYLGPVSVTGRAEGTLLLENRTPLETYLEGVVPSEMPVDYPDAALRAQAVAARTYAVAQILAARERGTRAVLDDTVASMAYRGREWVRPSTTAAVQATRGRILSWNGRPITAYFHSTCGGTTYSARDAFGDVDIPPLAGGVADPFCRGSKFAQWRAELPGSMLDSAMPKLDLGGSFRSILVSRTTLQRATRVRIESDGGVRELSGIDFRLACDPATLRSTYWTLVEPFADGIVVEGRGYGHGVGMCQVGAKGMAESGRDSTSILAHFYPSARLVDAYREPAGPTDTLTSWTLAATDRNAGVSNER